MLATNALTGSLTWLCPELRSGYQRFSMLLYKTWEWSTSKQL
jgi:hypothetical protein